MVESGTVSYTILYDEKGERISPCRCGKTHIGDYAIYEFGWHNCFHECDLIWIIKDRTLMCPDCGKIWGVSNE